MCVEFGRTAEAMIEVLKMQDVFVVFVNVIVKSDDNNDCNPLRL